MCGIVGGLDPRDSIRSTEERIRLRDLLRHRGPDGEGLWEADDRTWWLGHRRLSIIDLSAAGAQPMATPDGRFHLTYNGEMYDFPSVRKDLEASGIRFRGHSDTEVLLQLLARDGLAGFERIRGMFAFGLLDRERDELWLARDRIGQKPLYYWVSEDRKRLRFASELKAIAEDPTVDPVLDPAAVESFLAYQYIPCPDTIYRGVHKLAPGHRLVAKRLGDGTLKVDVAPYWELLYRPDIEMTEASALEELEGRLEEAVRMRMVSDVPLGAFLSGGVDSSLIVALMSRISADPIKTFTIGFAHEDYSEVPFARAVSQHVCSEHLVRILEPEGIELLPRLVDQFDEPFGDSSALPQHLVAQHARESVTVCLSGDAGDELFAGYNSYTSMMQAQRVNWLPRPLWRFLSWLAPDENVFRKRFQLLALDPAQRFTELQSIFPHWDRCGLFSEKFSVLLRSAERPEPFDRFRSFFDFPGENAPLLDRLENQDIHTYLTDDILAKVDRATMMNSLEARTPILDHPLVEFAARVPAKLRMRNGEQKYLLKKLARRLLPPHVVDRPKRGFSAPLKHWFRDELLPYTRNQLLGPESISSTLLNPSRVEAVVQRHQRMGRDFSGQIWNLLVLEHWCRQHSRALRELV